MFCLITNLLKLQRETGGQIHPLNENLFKRRYSLVGSSGGSYINVGAR